MHRPSGTAAVSVLLVGLVLMSVPQASASSTDVALRATAVNGDRPPSSFPTIAAAGDIACDPVSPAFHRLHGQPGACRMRYTSDLLVHARRKGNLAAVLTLGDNQYFCGGYRPFLRSYGQTWGRLKDLTHPTPGDHDYIIHSNPDASDCSDQADAAGYFRYFGDAAVDLDTGKSWYSFDVTTTDGTAWHIISLNAACEFVGGCGADSPQESWLRADLAANPATCTLAYWYAPRFSSGRHGSDPAYSAFWKDLSAAGAEIVLNGHDHDYERFSPQMPDQQVSRDGIREFVVGTGGVGHEAMRRHRETNSVLANDQTFGVLELSLRPTSYHWQFVAEKGHRFSDSGTGSCHPSPPFDGQPPTHLPP
ncbi:MAG: metallophosphoesterase family protein [Actinomycetota bacterium]